MSLIDVQDTKPSSHLTIDLASNNPFRNRTTSPISARVSPPPKSPAFSFDHSNMERPKSNNPFMDNPSAMTSFDGRPQTSPQEMVPPRLPGTVPPKQGGLMSNYDTLFQNLSLDNKSTSVEPPVRPPPPTGVRPSNFENKPPPRKSMAPLNGHRPSRSQEEEQRRRRAGQPGLRSAQTLDIFADPPDAVRGTRQRRNSESSVAERRRVLSPEDEKRRQERRRRDREGRRGPDGKSKPPSKKPNKTLDVIDKLDISDIYGTGLFHHDGPFDACRPHRNRKDSRKAPMQAFPKDSINNTLGGAGPVNRSLNLAQFHGRGEEGFADFSTSGKNNPLVETNSFTPYAGAPVVNQKRPVVNGSNIEGPSSFNPRGRDLVHGSESLGLGTSTFLEGAPASRTAVQRRESEGDHSSGGGLGRKKSLVQKIRGMNRERPSRRPMSPTSPSQNDGLRTSAPTSPLRGDESAVALSAGGMARVQEENQGTNPFFNDTNAQMATAKDYDDAYDKKGVRIQFAENEKLNRAREIEQAKASDSAQAMRDITAEGSLVRSGTTVVTDRRAAAPGLERRVTTDVVNTNQGGEKTPGLGGGFLNRVKSLKGGRRARPDRALG